LLGYHRAELAQTSWPARKMRVRYRSERTVVSSDGLTIKSLIKGQRKEKSRWKPEMQNEEERGVCAKGGKGKNRKISQQKTGQIRGVKSLSHNIGEAASGVSKD